MFNDTQKQDLNEATFTPDYGSDNHGIVYSCGHINPMQRALKMLSTKLEAIKATTEQSISNLQSTVKEIDGFMEEVLSFSENRCEDIREINRELRSTIDNGCGCETDYDDCPHCESYRDERDEKESELEESKEKIDALQTSIKKLEEQKEEQSKLASELLSKLTIQRKKFNMVASLCSDLEELCE